MFKSIDNILTVENDRKNAKRHFNLDLITVFKLKSFVKIHYHEHKFTCGIFLYIPEIDTNIVNH